MGVIDSSLGFDVDFPSDDFRSAITFAMQMGAPPEEDLQATFVFPSSTRTYSKGSSTLQASDVHLDGEGNPLDPDIKVTEGAPTTRRVDCGVEITEVARNELPVGNLRPSKATVTMLDIQYAQAKGCREMVYDGDHWLFSHEESAGLFDVGVFTLIFYAIDDN